MLFIITYDVDVKSGLEVLCCELKQIKIQYNRMKKYFFESNNLFFKSLI